MVSSVARWGKRTAAVLGFPALLLATWMIYQNAELMNPASPAGVWSLAAARDGYGAREIIDTWELLRPAAPVVDTVEGVVQGIPPSPVDTAIGVAQMRFLLIFLYAAALSGACVWTGAAAQMPLAGLSLAVGVWLAALVHAVETMAVLRMLLTRNPGDSDAVVASTCLWARVALLAVVVVWLLWASMRASRAQAAVKL